MSLRVPAQIPPRLLWPCSARITLLVALAILVPSFADPAFEKPTALSELGKGKFLVAHPDLPDPHFAETVVLLCEFGPDGAMGLVINRPTNVRLADALPNLPSLAGTPHRVFEGGPVRTDALVLLFRTRDKETTARRVFDDVAWGVDLGLLERLTKASASTSAFRAYVGYAGWGPGQLERELMGGSWVIVSGDAASIFERDAANLWADLLRHRAAPSTIRFPHAHRHTQERRQEGL